MTVFVCSIVLLYLWVRISPRARCTTLCNKVCQWLTADRWFSPGAPVSFTNKTDLHDITEILLKVALNTINQPTIYCVIDCLIGNFQYACSYIKTIRQATAWKHLRCRSTKCSTRRLPSLGLWSVFNNLNHSTTKVPFACSKASNEDHNFLFRLKFYTPQCPIPILWRFIEFWGRVQVIVLMKPVSNWLERVWV